MEIEELVLQYTIPIVVSFAAVIAVIALVVVFFLFLAKRLENSYVENLKGKEKVLLEAMEKDTIFERMVRGGRLLQYITILGAFAAVFFLALLRVISGELAGAIIGMIITGVIGAEAGARMPGETKREVTQSLKEIKRLKQGERPSSESEQ